jgi:hypothetical protein
MSQQPPPVKQQPRQGVKAASEEERKQRDTQARNNAEQRRYQRKKDDKEKKFKERQAMLASLEIPPDVLEMPDPLQDNRVKEKIQKFQQKKKQAYNSRVEIVTARYDVELFQLTTEENENRELVKDLKAVVDDEVVDKIKDDGDINMEVSALKINTC